MSIEIPEHLRYRAPVPRHNVGDVRSRYREPKQYIDPESYYQASRPAPRKTVAHNFRDVSSRYSQPKNTYRSPSAADAQLIPKTASIHMTDEYLAHKAYARASGVSNVQSHWHVQPNMEHVVSRRMEIEQQQSYERAAQVKEGVLFKVTGKAPDMSFGDLMHKNGVSTPRAQSPARKGAHSVVMNWVENGVPIPGREEILAPKSPRRVKSPEKPIFLTGSHSRPKVSPKYAQEREEKAVRILCENLLSARTRSPPRVAYLPPKYQAPPSPQRHRLSSPSRPRSTANNVMAKSPMRDAARSPLPLRRSESAMGTPMASRGSSVSQPPAQYARVPSQVHPRIEYGEASHRVAQPRGSSPLTHHSAPSVQRAHSPQRHLTNGASDALCINHPGAFTDSALPNGTSDFLPFTSVPPPQLRGRV